ncbi:MAG: hypothetical protein Q4B77_02860 [Coriobacteriaceae bacterium]|nr:hypothetical protein [Coriobacteriaceae bacterium]
MDVDLEELECDIAAMAAYWGERTTCWRASAADEFEAFVQPLAMREADPDFDIIQMINMCFTEWVLFERPLHDGRTPLQLYIGRAPNCIGSEAVERLRQVERTQFFSRFAILDKDSGAGVALLRDMRDDRVYDVHDPVLCEGRRWRDGTIAERIACVDGLWQVVGQARLYDRALPKYTEEDGPGELHEEDVGVPEIAHAGFFLRFLRDVLGAEGRYTPSLRAVAFQP